MDVKLSEFKEWLTLDARDLVVGPADIERGWRLCLLRVIDEFDKRFGA